MVTSEVVREASPEGWILRVTCDLDFERAERVRSGLEQCQEGPVVLDLSRCEFVDSTGVGVLADVLRSYDERRIDVLSVRLRPEVFEVLEIVGIVDVFGRERFFVAEEGALEQS